MPKKSKTIQYAPRKTTDAGAKQIVIKLFQYPIALVAVGTGGGKTFMGIRAIGALDKTAHIIVLTTKKQVDSGDWPASIDSYNQVTNNHLTYAVFNYEAINYQKAQTELKNSLKGHQNQAVYIIADEAHKCKKPTSNNFKHLKSLLKYPTVKKGILLSATPVSESLLDTAAYLILAGFYKNKSDFYKQHVTRYDKFFQPMIKDWNNQIHNEWLKDHEKIIDRFNKIQVKIDTAKLLPPIKYSEMTFEFDKPTLKAYRKIANDYRKGVYESIAEANAAQHEFVANHAEKRLKTLSQIIDNPKRPDGPVLIFYQYNADLAVLKAYLQEHYPNRPLYEINGAHHFDTKQQPEDNALFLCQYMASGEALNAKWSHVSVFYSPTYSWEKYKQARGRNARAYQDGTTYHIRFVVLDTINEHYWYDIIDNKKVFTQALAKEFLEED